MSEPMPRSNLHNGLSRPSTNPQHSRILSSAPLLPIRPPTSQTAFKSRRRIVPVALAGPIAVAPVAPVAHATHATHATHTAAAPTTKRRRVVPTPVAPAPAPAAPAPPAPPPAPPPAAAAPPVSHADCDPVSLNDPIRDLLAELRDDAGSMLSSPFAPEARDLATLDACVRGLRAAVNKARHDAAVAKRTAAAERARLIEELKPVKIERTQATKPIYAAHTAKMGGQCRYLYKCPCADALGVCAKGSASRPFHPSARNHVVAHIKRWHVGSDPLRTYRRNDAWWAGGADRARAKVRRVV